MMITQLKPVQVARALKKVPNLGTYLDFGLEACFMSHFHYSLRDSTADLSIATIGTDFHTGHRAPWSEEDVAELVEEHLFNHYFNGIGSFMLLTTGEVSIMPIGTESLPKGMTSLTKCLTKVRGERYQIGDWLIVPGGRGLELYQYRGEDLVAGKRILTLVSEEKVTIMEEHRCWKRPPNNIV